MSFYPSPDHLEHMTAENLLIQLCREKKIDIVNCPHYYQLPEIEKNLYKSNFSESSLFIRSLPDRLVLTKNPILVDVKSIVREDTGNIAIELSSYYFALQRSRIGLPSFFAYIQDKNLKMFTPLLNPPDVIFIQTKWKDNKGIQHIANDIKHYFESSVLLDIPIRNLETSGSGDPFVLISMKDMKSVFASTVIGGW